MAIRFACVSCGKQFRIPDDQAGLPGRCGRCGNRFTAPGVPVQGGTVASVGTQTSRHWFTRFSGSGTILAIGGGLLLAGVLAAAMFWFRDPIVAAVPGLAPLMPPKAAPVQKVPPRPPPVVVAAREPAGEAGTWTIDLSQVAFVAMMIASLAIFLLITLGPLIVPIRQSLRGRLSVGRWSALAALCVFLLVSDVVFVFVIGPMSTIGGGAAVGGGIGFVGGLFGTALFSGVCGCLIAAAIHPKTPPAGGL